MQRYVPSLLHYCLSFCSQKKLKDFNIDYLRIAVPISTLNVLTCLSQRIDLQYTTPSSYSFLEKLSVAAIPFAMFFMTGKKALQNESPAKVIIISPVSAIITGLVSCILGIDGISVRFVIGAILILTAVLISGFDGVNTKKQDG